VSIPEITQEAPNGVADTELLTQVEDAAPMASKAAWLKGPGDLIEFDLEVPGVGGTVKVRSLTAGASNLIQTECMTMKGDEMKFDTTRREVMTFAAGVVEPSFTEQEANVIAHKWGPAFKLVVSVINEISGTQDDALEKARRKFRHLLYNR
jgi:hypothetical protein